MASKKLIEEILEHLGKVYLREPTSMRMIDSYWQVLKKYPDQDVTNAAWKCLEELDFFPKPSQIIKRISKKEKSHNEWLRKRFTCMNCGNYVTASWILSASEKSCLCKECHDGVPKSMGRSPQKLISETGEKDFALAENIRCQQCGMIARCIKEPLSDAGCVWRCRKCHTGLTGEEIKAKYAEIVGKIGTLEEVPF